MEPNTIDSALQQAIQARSQGGAPVGQLNQTSQSAPAAMPPQVSSPQVPGATNMTGAVSTQPKPVAEVELITKALIQRQKALTDLDKQTKEQPTIQQMPIS